MQLSHYPGSVHYVCLTIALATWSLAANSQGEGGFWTSPVWPEGPTQAQRDNMRLVGYNALQARTAYYPEIKRQIVGGEERWIAYVGHHAGESLNTLTGSVEQNGTSIVDVTDPRNPVYLHHIVPVAGSSGAQMARVCMGDELPGGQAGRAYLLRAGASYHQVFDVTDPAAPELLSLIVDGLTDTHKTWWECETGIAYLVSGVPGWRTDRMTQIYDLGNPSEPKFIRNFGLVGQQPGATGVAPMELHGCISVVARNRVYCGHGTAARGVFVILDRDILINDLLVDSANPTAEELNAPVVGQLRLPDYMGAHTTFPILGMQLEEFSNDEVIGQQDFVAIVNEQTRNECTDQARQMMFMVEITDESHPWPVSTFNVPDASDDYCHRGGRFGAHGSNENFTPIYYGKLLFVTWFNAGVRAVDIRDPYNPIEVGYYVPGINENTAERCITVAGQDQCKVAIQTNNVEVDDRGYIYLVDRANTGMHIVELTRRARRLAEFPD
ncbi:MAG: hypothetical protein AAEI08_01110 [Gammaproteobacteria bacterium]